MSGLVADFEKIKAVLPHRYPFLLVDRVVNLTENSLVAIKNVSGNEEYFNGHFPERAVMPGVLQVEAMAQAAGLILALGEGFDQSRELAFLAGLDNVKFKRVVVPGDQLKIEANIVARKASMVKVSARTMVDGELASSAEIILVIRPTN